MYQTPPCHQSNPFQRMDLGSAVDVVQGAGLGKTPCQVSGHNKKTGFEGGERVDETRLKIYFFGFGIIAVRINYDVPFHDFEPF